MAETNPQPDPTPNPPVTGPEGAPETPQPAKEPQPATKVKKRRKWPWVLVILLLLILLLVASVPTIMSSGMGRSIIVSQVNQRINGRLEMQDLSLGWTSPIHADGIVIFDSSGRQILQLPHFETGLTVLNAVRGNYALGKTEIDGLDVLVSREANGALNWSQLAKATEPKKPEAKPEPAKSEGPSKLPSVSGELIVKNANITYEDRSPEHQPPVFVRALNADVKIPSINETITDTLSAEARIGSPNAKPGMISLDGSVAAVQNNVLALNSANVNQTVKLKDLSNAAISSVLGPKLRLDGQTDGQIVLQLSNGTNGTVQMLVQSNGFAARGATLNGAKLTSDGLTIALPRTTITVPQGIDHPENAKLQIGDGKTNAFTITLKNASVVQGEGASAKKVISSDTLTVLTACDVSTSAQGKDLKLTQFKIGDEQGIVSAAKDPAEDVAVTLPAQGDPVARGKIDLNADLKRLNDALQAMQGAQVVASDKKKGMELKSGLLKGTIALAQANAQQIQLNGDIGLSQITVGDDQTTPIKDDSLTLSLQALSNHDASQVQVPVLKVVGNLFGVVGKDVRLKLSNGSDPKAPPVGLLDMLQQADIRIEVPSLANLQKFLGAFSPSKKTARLNLPGPAFAYAGKVPSDAAPASQPAKPELPPADLTSGSATITLLVNSNGHQTEMRPGATITNLALKRGEFAYSAGDIALSTIIVATPAPFTPGAPAPSGLNEIQQLTISNLTLNAPTLKASASLAQPIEIKDPGGLADVFSPPTSGAKPRSASVNGRIRFTGELEPLIALNQAMSGEKAAHQMAGGFALDEGFNTDPSGAIGSRGQVDLTNLVVDGQADPETAFQISNDVSLSTAAKALAMNSVTIKATTTNCLDLTLKGKISDLGGKQQIQDQLTADLAYDLAPLWQVLQPLMSAEQRKSYADVQVAGKYQKQFVVTGAYPSGKPFSEAVQSVAVWGSLQFDDFVKKGIGIELKDADLPIDLAGGVARVQYHGKPEGKNLPPPTTCNGGKVDLSAITIDLKTQHTLITIPKGQQVLKDVSLNPALASVGLGDYFNNPVFVGAKEATGQLNMKAVSCDALAVDDLGAGIGSASLDMTIGTLQLGNPDLAKVLPQAFLKSLRGEVPAYHVNIANGKLSQDFTLVLLQSKRPIKLTGDVNLASKQMIDTTFIAPWSLFALKNPTVESLMPEGVKIPLKGQSNSPIPALDFDQLMQQNAGKALQNLFQQGKNNNQPSNQPNGQQDPLKALMDLLNQNKNKNNAPAQQQPPMQQQPPAQNQPDQDPAKALEDLINGNNAGNNNPNAPASQPAQQPQQQEDPIKALTDLFKKKKK